jgi:hypothetical protein
VLAAVIALVLLWWAWRRYRNRPKPPIDAYVKAQQDFAAIEARRLLETGEAAAYLVAMVDVAREYLAARVQGVRRSDTTFELLHAMKPRDGVETELPRWLGAADLVKFARAEVTDAQSAQAGQALRTIVDHVEARVNPESEVAKRLSAARKQAA